VLDFVQLLAKVTFAALRDPTRPDKEKYLVQRHTISMVPSLRVFERCNERLEILQKVDLVKENAIVALGDPVYGALDRLPGTETEVEDIKRQFPHGSVKVLLRDDATVEKLLHWVANPSHTSSRQVIVHIGAHGMVDKNDERNSCILLTDPGRESTPGGKLRTPEYEDRDEVIGGRSRMEYDEENDELSTMNERTERMMSDEVAQIMDRLEGKENTNDKDMNNSKGKVGEDLMENYSGKEMDKGKGKDESIHEQAEPSIEEIIQWAKKMLEKMDRLHYSVFVEHPELSKNIQKSSKEFRRNVHSSLALQDISDSKIPWKAELVVLSACHTSAGKATAEGLVNLARAFIIAGVPCVVASQWAVLDGFTSTLMKYFYYNLRHGQDVATSLRSAMSRMIDEGCSVKAWAPFVVWGSSSLVLPKDLRCC
jgi:CHAT domain-containing protein